ncbi:MAG: hypothetical protein A2087_01815 [Spirochaetes bacterium GWD1_61_31]|nr:MAG: hypothetical protein A2Y37_10180 [Spirochaetes bacterium GWB1_60_80]OHD29050.1 MAG: hypothetical protein A2004_14460 [Spirochaetes bacterium GWC1_61_12]OHD35916.1 MAG: hypothetical protein A2087_01815 [Spirochaetes bacterium GWD1_61_31]OHD44217.1 MAG: hypothetical protein A2Y35_06665 [Spirochaetes bacterium GWE1_60_18]OHD60423.1 MAG: hypothetical protein A2Y32_00860 [Spirochaetes bacterium GWF1_60_12]
MKIKDYSRVGLPDGTIIVPFLVLFIMSLNGMNIKEAFAGSLDLFFRSREAFALWGQVLVLDLAIHLFFHPVFKLYRRCLKACVPDKAAVDLAMRRLNHIRSFIIGVSIVVFTLGRLVLISLRPLEGNDPTPGVFMMMEALIAGFFVGVILALQFEDKLYAAKEKVLQLGSTLSSAYTPFYSKLVLILLALTLFMTLQAFSFASAAIFFMHAAPPGLPSNSDLRAAIDLFTQARRSEGLKALLNLFLLKTGILSAFIFQLLFQLKRLIRLPLATIANRLEALNSPNPAAGQAIAIVQNDEFASVFRQINSLISRQQGKLAASERRLMDIVAGAADPIIAFNTDRQLVLCNPAAENLLGCHHDKLAGVTLDRFLDDKGISSIFNADGSGLTPRARLPWRTPAGQDILLESHMSRTGEGQDSLFTVILRDISQQAELEATLQRAREEAENASRMKSEFLANMSHELRTPLNAILGYTQLIDNNANLTDEQRERVHIISRSGEHLLALINDILDISKIEAGKMELHDSDFDLHELIHDLEAMFELKCRKKGLTLYGEILDGLPRYVRGDLGKLRQVLVNLLGNAVKFTENGGVGLLAGPDGDGIRFSVRDTGRGIPADEQAGILQPFVQASTTDHEGGTGLGLAISSRYINMMGGSLNVKSQVGEGSEFSFRLSLGKASSAQAAAANEGFDITVPVGTPALIADDQETNRLVLKEFLERVGFRVMEARNGQEAIAVAREQRPAVIFMDIKMPVMDGYAAVAAFKADAGLRAIPVFALTASAFNHDHDRMQQAGFDGLLIKPFKQAALYRLIADQTDLETSVVLSGLPAAEAPSGAEPDAAELTAAAGVLGESGIKAVSNALDIADFAGLAALADSWLADAPAFARTLRAAARAFDEQAVSQLLAKLQKEATHGA